MLQNNIVNKGNGMLYLESMPFTILFVLIGGEKCVAQRVEVHV
ncbi:hypothetical protein DSOL_2530 [Desulfosporosinus metallidurans]|uniref:Uncharacterized protein n=1 Tax=Desulfosporosinus metallidurans TaxID=1888891 RepID=A0A1Q8QVY3_9FIRM|nr:hypothetical protein DSOL_2530 [Desulfosporosinus metallidurans]